MAYRVEFTPEALKQFSKLDQEIKKRITKQLKKVELLQSPRDIGKALQGELSNMWAYRVGNYRILSRIEDDRLLVLIVKLSHRSVVYKKT